MITITLTILTRAAVLSPATLNAIYHSSAGKIKSDFNDIVSQCRHCKKIFSIFVITTYLLLSNQLYNNLFS